MKKILLATTLLAASTGFAAAEVAVSGSARMGIIYDGADYDYSSRVRVKFVMTGETDGGLAFGAEVRNDQLGNGNTANGDSTVFISGAFGKLTMGDVGGAADALVGQVDGVGLTGLGDLNEIGFLGTTKTAAQYEYSAGALSFAVGLGQTGSDGYSVAAKYSTDAYSVALGYEDVAAATLLSLSGSATFSGATVKAKIADSNVAGADMAYALSVGYVMSGANVTAFYSDAGTAAYGLGASYDLGGGAKVVGGIAKAEGSKASFDLGVSMSF